ncbi:tyrosine-protein phosphatase YwqE [Thermonema lapsum]|uniref:protein-tyrosine-phosphatase n=1 Tax=Thermonema lapsum TaxID=28195 RepID=A0A846MNZ7_9BACT|nr:CpsB/CapC family capsule biosynthesis tyrosine phosphatase [Thermonema lapsum]NIK73283.1 tyrosine-protein phosphatase YwqE [Thermonema lapsum]
MWFGFWRSTHRHEKDLLSWIRHQIGADLHAHWLPAIDDGAKTFSEGANMLTLMQEMGWHTAVATPHILYPHYPNTPDSIAVTYEAMKTKLSSTSSLLPRTAYAAEYFADEYFFEAVKQDKPLLCFGERYVLMELPVFQQPQFLPSLLFELRRRAYVPVLAHPERYFYLGPALIELWHRYDGLLQLNLLSLLEHYGAGARKQAEALLKEGMADFVATDAHHVRHLQALWKLPSVSAWKLLQRHTFKNSLCLL